MYTINYSATNQLLRGSPWCPVSGSVGIYRASFEFSPDWNGLVKTAVFRSREATREQLLDGDDSCIVPWEPLQEPGWLEVGVYGVSGTTRLPTYWAAPVPIGDAPGKSDPAQEPSLDKWQQYIDQVKDTVPAAVKEYLDENPVTATEVDPTVPAWAKAPNKPTYTAKEVGALPADTKIPEVPTKVSQLENDAGYAKTTDIPTVPKKVSAFENDAGYLKEHQSLEGYAKETDIPTHLPNPRALQIMYPDGNIMDYNGSKDGIINLAPGFRNPYALTFTGAVEAEYDGSKAVTVEIPEGGSGSGLPSATTEDAGKFLRVGKDGAAAWETVAYAEGGSF